MASILDSIKKMLGIDLDDNSFDVELISHINSTLMILNQIGIGAESFSIESSENQWTDFLADAKDLEIVKSYVFLKVKLIFDPSGNSTVQEAYSRQIAEYEWRLSSQVNCKPLTIIEETG